MKNGTRALQCHIGKTGPTRHKVGEIMEEQRRIGVYHQNEIWVADVMSYFGEFVSEEEAIQMLEKEKGNSYFETMNSIRSILINRGYSVPFRATYRRTKDE